ncbi:amino acid adenylation domain-containing protein [Micromonosporaceae bacterium B7E4]
MNDTDIAIVGMAIRCPGAGSLERFWDNLAGGVESISFFPAGERQESPYFPVDPADPRFVAAAGVLEDADLFDAAFFGVSPAEAELMDPQHRLFLECAWEAVEDAGEDLTRTDRHVALYAGSGSSTYLMSVLGSAGSRVRGYQGVIGNDKDYLATRASYKLNLAGESVTVQTACSTSLVAVHLACQSLLSGQSDVAIAGGVSVEEHQKTGYLYDEDAIFSPDGHTRAFDRSAQGTVFSNGLGLVVLKPVSDAVRDRNRIYAVIKGSFVNNDAASKVSYTAPSVDAQAAAVAGALEFAGVPADTIGYVETHGTGTRLGDPIEVNALTQAFRQFTDRRQFCAIGSVKTNIGHLDVAAGVAGLIKTALALHHRRLPPSLHYTAPNPDIDFAGSPFYVNTSSREWTADGPLRAGVSSFGIGGTNAHVVLEEAPAEAAAPAGPAVPERPYHVLALSAKSETALRRLAARHHDHLARPDVSLPDHCFTANDGRARFAHRLAVTGPSAGQLRAALGRYRDGEDPGPELVAGHADRQPAVAFLFTGGGAQYPGMGQELYRTLPAFRRAFDECAEVLRGRLDRPLPAYLGREPEVAASLRDSRVVQPVLFALEYALAQTWLAWGVRPDAVLGHSVGEYVAACVAGAVSLEDGLRMVAERGRLVHEAELDGLMLAVFAPVEEVLPALEPLRGRVSLAAVNGPRHVVVSGDRGAVLELRAMFEARDVPLREVPTDFPSHSPLVEPILPAYRAALDPLRVAAPRIPLVSGLTGRPVEGSDLDPEYWVAQLRQPVLFASGVTELASQGIEVFLEVGPQPALSRMGALAVPAEGLTWLSSLHPELGDWAAMLAGLGGLHAAGVPVDWAAFDAPWERRRVALPSYPFERQRYWLPGPAPVRPTGAAAAPTPELASTVEAASPVPTAATEPAVPTAADVEARLRSLTAQLLRTSPDRVDPRASLLAVGLDSLVLIEAVHAVEKTYGVRLRVRQLLSELTTLEAIAAYVAERAPAERAPADGAVAPADGTAAPADGVASPVGPAPTTGPHPTAAVVPTASGEEITPHGGAAEPFVPYRPITVRPSGAGTGSPRALSAFVAAYTVRTPGSKRLAGEHRPVLADNDNRVVSDFRMAIKEMVYPIVADRSSGARLWDVDGNEYVDVMMGFGCNLFGHSPDFVTEAVRAQLDRGVQIGAQSDRAGQVATQLSELTGLARVAFCNSGSEAVMTALRLARAATGRAKVAMFAGSYHGIFDGTLGSMRRLRPDLPPAPIAPGVLQHMVDDLIVLPYGEPASLAALRACRHELAAVLVEPVQSRRPDVQPAEFLRELRELTMEAGAALIFDEIITGLRVHPGGAQQWFGVTADLATYGKVLGGGLPIGAVAGSPRFLDAIDGGAWRYGDDSYPTADTTFFAGTFCKHPLAMAAASATLAELRRQGPGLQEGLNQRTTALAGRLNEFFTEESVPMRLAHFGSLFRFFSTHDIHLLYYHLVHRGVHIREGHNAFLSAAHTDEDVDRIAQSVIDSVLAMRSAGLLPADAAPTLATPTPAAPATVTAPAGPAVGARAVAAHAAPGVAPIPSRPPAAEPAEPAPFPMTGAQRQLWTLAGLDPQASVAYHQTSALRVDGALDVAALRRAVRRVVRRHEALRTVFEVDRPWQRVRPDITVDVPVVEPPADRRGDVADWIAERERQPFDLAEGPLLRLTAVRLDPDRHLLVLCGHHIVLDGLSVGLLWQEIAASYSAECRGETWAPPEPMQFREYARWLADLLAGPDAAALEEFWVERLRGPLPTLDLPTDRARPAVRGYRGARHTARLDAALVAELRALGVRTGHTLFMVLLAAYQVLLHRLTGQDDQVVGVPVAGRTPEGAATVLGHCINLLPVRGRVAGDASFTDLLRRTGDTLLDGAERQDFPVGLLVQRLDLPTDAARALLSGTVFNLDRAVPPPALGDLRVAEVALPTAHVQFDLGLNLVEQADGLRMEVEYRTDLFDPATVTRWAGHFETVLRGIVADPEAAVARLSPLSGRQRHEIVEEWNATAESYPEGCLPDLFAAQARRTPDAPSLLAGDRSVSYRGLDEAADRLARVLRDRGVRPDDVAAVCAERSVAAVTAILAVLKAGGAYLPLDPAHPAPRLAEAVAASGSRLVLAEARWAARFADGDVSVVELDASGAAVDGPAPDGPAPDGPAAAGPAPDERVAGRPVHPDQAAFVLYTSGSTGRPKAVVGTHRAVLNRLRWMAGQHPFRPGEVCCQKTASTFVDSLAELFGPLLAGVPLAILPAEVTEDPLRLLRTLDQRRVTRIVLVPSLLRILLQTIESTGVRPSALTHWTVSGEALPAALAERFHALLPGATLLNLYGSTEVMADATWHECVPAPAGAQLSVPEPESVGAGTVPIGRPIANTEVYVLDRWGAPVPVGIAGELYVGGAGVARGYLGAPALTAERFVPNPFPGRAGARLFRTGDLARYRPGGTLEFLGRTDRQVKIRGMRVEPAEVEAVLAGHPGISRSAVLDHPDASGGVRLVAYVEATEADATEVDAAGLREFLADRLPEHLVPADVVVLPLIPLTASGKTDRLALRALAPPAEAEPEAYVAPRNPVEEILHGICADLLGEPRVSMEASLFNVGANSLTVMQLVPRIHEEFGVEVGVVELFETPTIAGMAVAIESALVASAAPGTAERLLSVLERLDETEATRMLSDPAPLDGLASVTEASDGGQ